MDLGSLGEFGFVDRVRGLVGRGTTVVGIGDDAAVVRAPAGLLVATTDTLVEDVHFRFGWSRPADVGWKAVAVNVSDLAAMGAEPRWILVSLAAPASTGIGVLDGLYEGVLEACQRHGAELVGGDTVRAPQLVVSVTALGEVDGEPLRRSGAVAGDVLAVTGPLGRAAVGVNLLLSGDPRDVSPDDALACMDAHRRPQPRVDEGLALRRAGAHAAMDLSDGLLSDVRRLSEASGVGVEIDAEAVPVAGEARRVAEARGWDVERVAFAGGEDFELLAALPDRALAGAEVRLHPIGRVVTEGLWLLRGGERLALPEGGWDHFAAPG